MNGPLKPINTSFYDFEKLVTGGFVYVDDPRRVVYVGVNYDPAA